MPSSTSLEGTSSVNAGSASSPASASSATSANDAAVACDRSPSVRPICMQSPSCVVVCCLAETAAPMVFVACTSRFNRRLAFLARRLAFFAVTRSTRSTSSAAGSTGTPARLVARRNERRNPGDRKEPAAGASRLREGDRGGDDSGSGSASGRSGVAVPGSRTASVPRKSRVSAEVSASPADAARRRRKEEARDELGGSSSSPSSSASAPASRAPSEPRRATGDAGGEDRDGVSSDTADAGTASSSSSESTTSSGWARSPAAASLGSGMFPSPPSRDPAAATGPEEDDDAAPFFLFFLRPMRKTSPDGRDERIRRRALDDVARGEGGRAGETGESPSDRSFAVGRRKAEKRCSRQTLFAFFRRLVPVENSNGDRAKSCRQAVCDVSWAASATTTVAKLCFP